MTSVDIDSGSETLRITEDPGRGFLGNLTPSVFQRYSYRDQAQFKNDFDHAFHAINNTIEWFLVSEVDDKTFAAEFLEAEEAPFSRWCAYDRTLKLLLINIVKSKAHENVAGVFDFMFHEALIAVGMGRSLDTICAATHFATIGGKQPDRAWQPIRLPRDRSDKWPTVVLEVAYSETQSKLQSDLSESLKMSPELPLKDGKAQEMVMVAVSKRSSSQEHAAIRSPSLELRLCLNLKGFSSEPQLSPENKIIEIDDEKLEFLATRVWDKQWS